MDWKGIKLIDLNFELVDLNEVLETFLKNDTQSFLFTLKYQVFSSHRPDIP